ncbi:uncharacterized protein LOC132193439 [Neocloeon triangulifer]|uniref:uncharacterized protein LOC132193439 n=1 Tax=Neocloeon triangulifer TaxID=2078957 RepID=UPI00286F0B0C|nr:uncharacterized protein LOC132193439 [Neocloeon triangulifer]
MGGENRLRLLLLLFSFSQASNGLRDLQIKVPEAVRRGSSVELTCDYDLEGALLYSIKWYKDEQEFFNFVAKEAPPTRVFPVPGVLVDEFRSGNKSVVLRDVQRDLTGNYKCEVSGDQPTFHTDVKSAPMLVVDVPQETPRIEIEKYRFKTDEPILANCTSALSFPAPNITWFVNGMQISPKRSWIKEEGAGLETAISELRLYRPVFSEGKLNLRCVASLFNLYRRIGEAVVYQADQETSPWPPASVRHSDSAGAAGRSFEAVVAALLATIISIIR